MPVYYSRDDEDEVFHVFLGCAEGAKIDADDRVEKLKKRTLCSSCLVLMKNGSWTRSPADCGHEEIRRTGS
ncbi:MAG: hypothetical protein ACRDY1_14655 [Acidimicrobiales bacterium]